MSYFLWPTANKCNALDLLNARYSAEDVEQKLASNFEGAYPVLYNSGRSAIYHLLKHLGHSRIDEIGVFPLASHCVLESVSRIATPSSIGINKETNIIYHQWGYKVPFKSAKNSRSNTIDDCVDSLAKPGCLLFPSFGDYEIWSLPKIFATSSGGVLWCRNYSDSKSLQHSRNANGSSLLPWMLRIASMKNANAYSFWSAIEATSGKPTKFQSSEIYTKLDSWKSIINDRQLKYRMLKFYLSEGMQLLEERLPSNIAITYNKFSQARICSLLEGLGLTSGIRNSYAINHQENSLNLEKHFLVPIHQDVPASLIHQLVKELAKVNV